jgi:hypothetical protein
VSANYVVDFSGMDVLLNTMDRDIDAFGRGVCEDMVTDIKLSLQEVSPGRKETRYNPRRDVTVSRPGDPPNVDTGALINSIHWEPQGPGRWWIMDGVEYGQYLEEVWNRPFMQPVFEVWQRRLPDEARRRGIIR